MFFLLESREVMCVSRREFASFYEKHFNTEKHHCNSDQY